MGKEMTKVKLWAARFFQIWMEKKVEQEKEEKLQQMSV